MKQYEKILKAFANKRRLEILKYLKNHKEAVVGDIAEHIRLSLKATSKHLQILSSAEIVESRQKSLFVIYSLELKQSALAKSILSNL